MQKKLWFKAKTYGWGWTPCAWQGWFVLAGFIILDVLNFFRLDAYSHSVSDTVRPFILESFILTAILLWICYRTGEKPHWRWGKDT
jgi:hypothetical protein